MNKNTSTTLPPVETTPLLLMRFTSKTPPSLLSFIQERLHEGGLYVLEKDTTPEGQVLLALTAHAPELHAEAQHSRLKKRTHDTHIMEYVQVSNLSQFCCPSFDTNQVVRDSMGLFSYNDWSLLIWNMLDNIDVLPAGQVSSNLSRALDGAQVVYYTSTNNNSQRGNVVLSTTLQQQQQQQQQRSDCLRHVLQAHEFVDLVTPLHLPMVRNALWNQTWHRWLPDIEAIRDYYGEEVAFYFAWMAHLTKWLCAPAVLGVVVYVLRLLRHETVDDDELSALYGLICFVWAVLFCIFWERQEHRLAYNWGTFSPSDYQKQRYFTKRPEFRGTVRISPVTGQLEMYYPTYKRHLKMAVSALVTCLLLGVAFIVMILSLNLQGYINPKTDPKRWTATYPHPFHVPYFSALAEAGQVFDASSQWRCLLPVIVHVCCIFSMNLMYRTVAEWLTEWENHETHRTHRNSLILKRFLFEAFDCYVALFYLAFYERDVHRLRLELISVFNIDTFRRLLLECILPMIVQRVSHRRSTTTTTRTMEHKKTDTMTTTTTTTTTTSSEPSSRLVDEVDRDEYEQFDDYMEIVIELGYVTLFAAAFPLASVIAIVSNLVEMHADCFKLTYLCRKPRSFRSDGLGMWKTLIHAIVWLSALTNCLIFGFTSDQMMAFLPGYYVYEDDNDKTRLAPNHGWIVIFVIFSLERALIYAGLVLWAVVPSIPEDVMDELERRHWVRDQESKQWRHEDRKLRSDTSLLSQSDLTSFMTEDPLAHIQKRGNGTWMNRSEDLAPVTEEESRKLK